MRFNIQYDDGSEINIKEILQKKVKPFGNSAHLPMPKRYVDKNTIIIICEKQIKENKIDKHKPKTKTKGGEN